MAPIFSYQPVQLAQGNPEREGVLVFWGADLLAVLVRLSPETHDGHGGLWFLEAGFGSCADKSAPLFSTPQDAEPWFSEQMSKILRRTSTQDENLTSPDQTGKPPRETFH